MATSQNGYTVLTDRTSGELPRLRKWQIPGCDRHVFLRDGSVGFLLVHFALWWHEKISALDTGVWDEWGWAVRPIRGQTTGYSNHASGTAIDLDSTKHPLGKSPVLTFKTAQIIAIRLRIRWMRGTLVWGGDWSRPDAMHTEIGADLAACETLARRLLDSPRGRRVLAANPGARDVILS